MKYRNGGSYDEENRNVNERRLRVTQCEEHRAADRARNRRHKAS